MEEFSLCRGEVCIDLATTNTNHLALLLIGVGIGLLLTKSI